MSLNKLMIGLVSLLLSVAARAEEIGQTPPEPPPMRTPTESGMAPVNDIQMHYAVYGQGDPVLLLHGGLGNAGDSGPSGPSTTRVGMSRQRLWPGMKTMTGGSGGTARKTWVT